MNEERDPRMPVTEDRGDYPPQRRRRVVEVLKEHGPLACKEIVSHLPPTEYVREWPCPEPAFHERDDTVCVHASQTTTWVPGYATVYADLRLLENQHLVARHDQVGRTWRWKAWTPQDDEVEVILSIMRGAGLR